MAWNKPAANPQPKQKKPSAKPSLKHGIIAGAAVVVLGLAALWIFSGGDAAPKTKDEKTPARIKEVKPAVTNKPAAAESPVPIDKSKLSPAWQKYYDGRDTNLWMVVYNPLTKKEYISRKVKTGLKNAPPPLYKARALNILDAIAFKPIKSAMPNVNIDGRYMQSFQEALTEKIVIDPDDSEEVKARKQGMIELMADLKARLKNGEDIQKLIADSLADRNRVAALKRAMKTEIGTMRRNGASEGEIAEFARLCNKRLEEKGSTPIMTSAMLRERMEQRAEFESLKVGDEKSNPKE